MRDYAGLERVDEDGNPDENGEYVRLNESGEARAVDLLGGQDVVNAVAGLKAAFEKHGLKIGSPERVQEFFASGPLPYFLLQQVVHFFVETTNLRDQPAWEHMVKDLEDNYLAPIGYFDKHPHAFDVARLPAAGEET